MLHVEETVTVNRLNRRLFVRLGLAGTATMLGGRAIAAKADAKKAAPAAEPKGHHWAEGDMVLGKADAPVEIIEYASMTCSHCATFDLDVLPELQKRYIDPGKVRLVFREFPLDAVAVRGAMLARCAGPDRFFGVVQLLFQQQKTWAGPDTKDPTAALKRIGEIVGVSDDDFDACMADKPLMDRIVQSRLDAEKKYEIESTPSFVIGGKVHSGEMTIDAMSKLIDPLLAKS
jgi:protein-disulfide isomerase